MSHFKSVALEHASRLINPGPTVLVTSRHGERSNIMAAAWSMPVEFIPPRIAIVIDKKTLTKELVSASGIFGICIPGAALAELTYAVGSCSGHDADKFSRFGIQSIASPLLGLPVVEEGCLAWLECRLIPEAHTETAYDTCFGEVVGASADSRVFANGRWNLAVGDAALHTIHHLGAGNFAHASEILAAGRPPTS